MANKEYVNKDKKKRSARDFKELDEISEKKTDYNNKEISVIYPVADEVKKKDEGKDI